MNIPQLTTKHDYSDRWNDVCTGRAEPDEYQTALMNIVQDALDSGLYYTMDVHKYAKKHATFIPAEYWDLQYNTAVEGGVMGMELYKAREALDKKAERAADDHALQILSVGQSLGTLYINAKRYTKCKITAIEGRDITMTGTTPGTLWQFHVAPRSINTMIERAIARGWRKA